MQKRSNDTLALAILFLFLGAWIVRGFHFALSDVAIFVAFTWWSLRNHLSRIEDKLDEIRIFAAFRD